MKSLMLALIALPLLEAVYGNESSSIAIQELLLRQPQAIEGGRAGNLRERALSRLSKAQALMAKEKYDESLNILSGLETSLASNKFGLAQVYQTKAYVYAQTDRFKEAEDFFKKCLNLKGLPKAPSLNTVYSLSQVLVAQEKYLEAVPYIQDYLFSKDPPRPDAYFFYSQVLAQLKQVAAATKNIERALSLEATPKESWLRFAVALYYEQKLYAKAAAALETLVTMTPVKTKYWKQLSSVYLAQNQEMKALAVLEAAHKNKVLKEEKDILQLVRLSLYQGVPYKAAGYLKEALDADIVSKGAKNYEILAESWVQAQELDRALIAFQQAAPLAKDGNLYLRQGQLYLAKENWSASIESLNQSLQKGGLKREGLAHVALGIAYYSAGSKERALGSFRKAMEFPKYKREASEWINHLNTESASASEEDDSGESTTH